MVTVLLRAPLKDLADGHAEADVDAPTVAAAVKELEATYPRLVGWILDEQGHVRRHINIFVNGERVSEDAEIHPADRLHVLPSISGG